MRLRQGNRGHDRPSQVGPYHELRLREDRGPALGRPRTRRARKNSASGVTGVYWDSTRKHWVAHIYFRRERLVLGRFEDFNEAVAARRNAEEAVYGFVLDEVDDLDRNS